MRALWPSSSLAARPTISHSRSLTSVRRRSIDDADPGRRGLDDRLQAGLARSQGLLGVSALGHVADEAVVGERVSVGGAMDDGRVADPADGPVLALDPVLDRGTVLARVEAARASLDEGPVLGDDHLQPEMRIRLQLRAAVAGQGQAAFPMTRLDASSGLEPHGVDVVRGRRDDPPLALLALAEGCVLGAQGTEQRLQRVRTGLAIRRHRALRGRRAHVAARRRGPPRGVGFRRAG